MIDFWFPIIDFWDDRNISSVFLFKDTYETFGTVIDDHVDARPPPMHMQIVLKEILFKLEWHIKQPRLNIKVESLNNILRLLAELFARNVQFNNCFNQTSFNGRSKVLVVISLPFYELFVDRNFHTTWPIHLHFKLCVFICSAQICQCRFQLSWSQNPKDTTLILAHLCLMA